MTGRLCSMCAHVTATERSLYRAEAIVKRYETLDNLEVYAGDIAELEFDRQFDYIVLVGILERVGGGTTSAPEPHANRAFDGLNRSYESVSARFLRIDECSLEHPTAQVVIFFINF